MNFTVIHFPEITNIREIIEYDFEASLLFIKQKSPEHNDR